jgi:hypothetical protein
VPAGTEIEIFAPGSTLASKPLSMFITPNATDGPTVTSGGLLNTGFEPFAQNPVFISNSPSGVGTTEFD